MCKRYNTSCSIVVSNLTTNLAQTDFTIEFRWFQSALPLIWSYLSIAKTLYKYNKFGKQK